LCNTLIQAAGRRVIFYHPGLGTMEPTRELSPIRRRLAKALGLAVGYGLEDDIRDAYVFLMNQFEPGDRLFLFGFSRGAYTARAVTALLHMYGLIRPGNEPLILYAIRMMMGIQAFSESKSARAQELRHNYFELATQFFKQHFS